MKDQSDKLEEKGLDVANLNSSVSESEQKESLEQVEARTKRFYFHDARTLDESRISANAQRQND
jgi:superfamily II DNA helicase RecQ